MVLARVGKINASTAGRIVQPELVPGAQNGKSQALTSPLWPVLGELADWQPRMASELLERLAPSLREVGIVVEQGSAGRGAKRCKTLALKEREG